MSLDLVLLALVGVFALVGAMAGAARQIASLVATVAAYLCARPLGNVFGPRVAGSIHGPQLFGVLVVTLLAFVAVLISVRYIVTAVLRRLLRGEEREHANVDRLLGFILGGAKVALIAYVMLSALTFVEENVTFAGKRLGITAEGSQAFALARRYNLFARLQFAPVKDLIRIAQALQDPNKAAQLKDDPAFRALLADPRFQSALSSRGMNEALESGDYAALLRSNSVLQLVQDRLAAERMSAAAEVAERTPPRGLTPPGPREKPSGSPPHRNR
jgi:membrane protein required for colicin V production